MSSDELLRPPPEYQPDELSEQPLTFNQMFDQMIEQFATSGDASLWMHELPNRNLAKFFRETWGTTQKGLSKWPAKIDRETNTRHANNTRDGGVAEI